MPRLDPKKISVVLVEPTQPGNIGSTARAMDNMGVENLLLVSPCDHLAEEARKFATNAAFILENAQVFQTLEEAVSDHQWILGTSARSREKIQRFTDLHQIDQELPENAEETKVALVFGRERAGLTNSEICLCNQWVQIPTFGRNSSLNLSQAVLILLYELSRQFESSHSGKLPSMANSKSIEGLKNHLFQVLEAVRFIRPGKMESLWESFSSLIGRARLDEREIKMIRGFFNKIELSLGTKKRRKP